MNPRTSGQLVLILLAAISCGDERSSFVDPEPEKPASSQQPPKPDLDSGLAAKPLQGDSGTRPDGLVGQDAGVAEAGSAADPDPMTGTLPLFTFFTTSEAGIRSLAPDPERGFGGDLGGLLGADKICETLAKRGNPGDTKIWRAFLSVTDDGDGNEVHAIERIGKGPWHDLNGRLLASDPAGLLPDEGETGGRPKDAEPQLAEMFTDEYGDPLSPDVERVDNHDILTGTGTDGRLDGGKRRTCQDWTSADPEANGQPRIGHAWPRSSNSGRNWMSDHHAGGCGAGIDTTSGADNGEKTVGSGGGYGGLYCFAVTE